MIKHVWSVLCQNASFDNQTNSVSMFNALENIFTLIEPSKEIPAQLSCEIVSLWVREKEEVGSSGQMRVLLSAPGKTSSQLINLEIDLTHTAFHRTRITIGMLQLSSSGRHEFKVEYQINGEETWQLATTLPFFIVLHPNGAVITPNN